MEQHFSTQAHLNERIANLSQTARVEWVPDSPDTPDGRPGLDAHLFGQERSDCSEASPFVKRDSGNNNNEVFPPATPEVSSLHGAGDVPVTMEQVKEMIAEKEREKERKEEVERKAAQASVDAQDEKIARLSAAVTDISSTVGNEVSERANIVNSVTALSAEVADNKKKTETKVELLARAIVANNERIDTVDDRVELLEGSITISSLTGKLRRSLRKNSALVAAPPSLGAEIQEPIISPRTQRLNAAVGNGQLFFAWRNFNNGENPEPKSKKWSNIHEAMADRNFRVVIGKDWDETLSEDRGFILHKLRTARAQYAKEHEKEPE